MLDIEQVVLKLDQFVLLRAAIATLHLCPAREPGPDVKAITVKWVALCQFGDVFRALRSWTDQAHVASYNIEYLRQLIQVCRTKKASHACHPSITLRRPGSACRALCTRSHGSELQHTKRSSSISGPFLAQQYLSQHFH